MNKVSGYLEFKLQSGRVIKLKYGNGTTEMYAEMQGFTKLSEVNNSLNFGEVTPVLDAEGQVVLDAEGHVVLNREVPVSLIVAVRRLVYCAAKYVCMREGTEVDFDEYDAGEWAEEIEFEKILGGFEEPPKSEQADSKKKIQQTKKPLIKPTQ